MRCLVARRGTAGICAETHLYRWHHTHNRNVGTPSCMRVAHDRCPLRHGAPRSVGCGCRKRGRDSLSQFARSRSHSKQAHGPILPFPGAMAGHDLVSSIPVPSREPSDPATRPRRRDCRGSRFSSTRSVHGCLPRHPTIDHVIPSCSFLHPCPKRTRCAQPTTKEEDVAHFGKLRVAPLINALLTRYCLPAAYM